ncbi:metallophosphoesterase [Flaviaesturariibacter aridisoli]|uniref:Metallophosphoesterase n=1 Tax=Flaviaesturariibacter aridisoli TaxID=2545761 RepID=A0A4R4DZ44_9BACT|nr:metallophosphoesterase [Flaviaesturariibacter aridisoli]TCZ71414.1 metallophosphoesterase [Flaviaesturariibacter aridisoli]
MRNLPFSLVLIAVMLLLDFYVFSVLKGVSQGAAQRTRSILFAVYWTLSAMALVALLFMPAINASGLPKGLRNALFVTMVGLFFAKLVAAIFFLIDDIRRGFQWVAGRLFFTNTEAEQIQSNGGISRSVFLSWLGLAAGGALFTSLMYGMGNKYAYRVHRVKLRFPNLPLAFRGLRVVQLSDIHSGSFTDHDAVARGVQKVLDLKPDLILFTGDLVNNTSDEMDRFLELFGRLKAPMGVFSTLGNHDYGDYVQWPTADAKRANLERLKSMHAQMGWRLLMNEHVLLERGTDRIAVLGIENWGAKARFPKYGKMSEAYPGTESVPFKILMSHDPSHWDAEVRPRYGDIDLTLAGHTHGMQFGVELPGFRWSPVQYVYKQWAGLYEEGAQKLYVNRGFGFLGYPGRVGILPEISLLEFE